MSLSTERIQAIERRDALVFSSKTFTRIAHSYNLKEKRVLDIGCGYGEYMQRFGKNSLGITTRTEESEYGKMKGRDIRIGNAEFLDETIDSTSEYFDAIWCNNIFEHLLSPHAFLVKLKKFAHKDTLLILGTPVVPFFPPLRKLPRFGGAISNSHINFFNYITYSATVHYAGWKELACRSFFFQNKLLDHLTHYLAPHLYIVAKNNAQYQYSIKKANEWVEDAHYTELLRTMGYTTQTETPPQGNSTDN